MHGRDWQFRLRDMLQYAETASSYVEGVTFEAFVQDQMRTFAVLHTLEIIGEAARHVPEDVRDRLPDVPWRAIAGMRNRIAHGYASVDLAIVWTTATFETPKLAEILRRYLSDLGSE